jgi:hypothetical protein
VRCHFGHRTLGFLPFNLLDEALCIFVTLPTASFFSAFADPTRLSQGLWAMKTK